MKKKKNADRRRLEIIRKARLLFKTKNYENTTINEITASLNIAKGTVYHYFSSKEMLLEAVVEDIINEEFNKKLELLNSDRVKDLSALEKLKIIITENTIVLENHSIIDTLHNPDNTLMYTKQLGSYVTKLAPIYASLFKQGCDEGIFRTEHPLECAEFILAGLQYIMDSGFYPWNNSQLNRRFNAIPFLIEAQLDALAGTFSFLTKNNIINKEKIL